MIETFHTPELLADAVARHVAARAAEAISTNGQFTLALSGGSTPEAAYRQLGDGDIRPMSGLGRLTTDDWRLVHVLWGDERCVPPDDPRSNYRMAKEALLDRVPIAPDHIHRIRGEDEPEKAAADYERELRDLLRSRNDSGDSSDSSPALDLVLLGLGEDGHTASLFPGQPSVHETERWVVAVPAPDKKLWRVTLTPGILNRARNVTFIVSGAEKAQTLQRVLEEPADPDRLPAQAIRSRHGRPTWMVDDAAAGRLRATRART